MGRHGGKVCQNESGWGTNAACAAQCTGRDQSPR
jgi:hypothetical protein